jgi:hypothetical protein
MCHIGGGAVRYDDPIVDHVEGVRGVGDSRAP